MYPSAGLRGCQQCFRGAVPVVNPWMLVLVGVVASRGSWGAVAVLNPWVLVLVAVLASRAAGVLWLG